LFRQKVSDRSSDSSEYKNLAGFGDCEILFKEGFSPTFKPFLLSNFPSPHRAPVMLPSNATVFGLMGQGQCNASSSLKAYLYIPSNCVSSALPVRLHQASLAIITPSHLLALSRPISRLLHPIIVSSIPSISIDSLLTRRKSSTPLSFFHRPALLQSAQELPSRSSAQKVNIESESLLFFHFLVICFFGSLHPPIASFLAIFFKSDSLWILYMQAAFFLRTLNF
jgi:hypothetical protein